MSEESEGKYINASESNIELSDEITEQPDWKKITVKNLAEREIIEREANSIRAVIQSRTVDNGDETGTIELDLDLPTEFESGEPKPLTWKFEEKDYPVFIADRTGNIGVPLIHPNTDKKVAVIGANFSWEEQKSQPFLDHLNLHFEDITNANEEVSETKRKNLTKQNVNLFSSLIVDGWLTKINEFGESGTQVAKTREQMLSYPEDIQSKMIDEWLGRFYIERHFPQGSDEIDILLGQVDSVFFKCKIGNVQNPAHVLLLEFKLPSNDAQRAYDDDTRREKRPLDRPNVRLIEIKHDVKLRYAKKHLIGVQGAVVISENHDGGITTHVDNILPVNSDQTLKQFKDGFNPQWFVRLADALHGTFNIMGK